MLTDTTFNYACSLSGVVVLSVWRVGIDAIFGDSLVVGWSQPNTARTTGTIAASHRASTPRPHVRDVEGATWQGLCVDGVLGLLRTYSYFVLVMSVV